MFQIRTKVNGMKKSCWKVSSVETNVKDSIQFTTASNLTNANAGQSY